MKGIDRHDGRAASMAVGALAVALVLLHQPWRQPVLESSAYFLYIAQEMLRGVPLYEGTTLGYTPVGVFALAAAMRLGALFGVADYLAPRLPALLLAAASVVLLFRVTSRFFRNVWAGAAAATALCAFETFVTFSAASLDPKLLVQFFALATAAAVQARRWLLAGAIAAIGAMTWQPALWIAMAAMVTAAFMSRRANDAGAAGPGGPRPPAAVRFLVGMGAGAAPVVLYLLATQQMGVFFRNAVLFKLQPRPEIVGASLPNPLSMAFTSLQAVGPLAFPVLLVAAGGVLVFLIRLLRRGPRRALGVVSQPRGGALFFMTLGVLLYTGISAIVRAETRNFADIVPAVFLIAFWFASACHALTTRSARGARRLRFRATLLPACAVALAALALARAATYDVELPLQTQLRSVDDVTAGRNLVAINMHEYYVLTGSRMPWRTVDLSSYFMEQRRWLSEDSCDEVRATLDNPAYQRIVVRDLPGPEHQCLAGIVGWLRRDYVELEPLPAPRRCGTGRMIDALFRPAPTAPSDLGSWADCVWRRVGAGYQFRRRFDILVFDRPSAEDHP